MWTTTLDDGTRVVTPGGYAVDVTGDGNDDLVVTLSNVVLLSGTPMRQTAPGTLS